MKSRYVSLRALAIGVLLTLTGAAGAQAPYPNKPIRIIQPFTAGGGTDILARDIGHRLTERLGQPVIVESRPGGNSTIGTEVVAKSAADGYTLLMTISDHVIIPHLYTTRYDPVNDFAAIANVASVERVLVLHPSVPAKDMQQLIALVKSKPGQLGIGVAGGSGRVVTELFKSKVGLQLVDVPYKGASQAMTDLLGGQVPMFLSSVATARQHINNGTLTAIAVTGRKRSQAIPQVPTFDEVGLSGFGGTLWYGLLAPAGTPKNIIDTLSAEINGIMALPAMRDKLIAQGQDPNTSSPAEFAALIKSDSATYAKVIKDANIKPE
ncbi:MAG: Bug family tripartite tricarboxylate transporter substrate binding protein [Burkholderiaceae bacterium]